MSRDKAEGVHQSAKSVKGMFHAKKSAGSETIKSEEYVGSKHSGIKFGMPKGTIDHSNVRGSIGKE